MLLCHLPCHMKTTSFKFFFFQNTKYVIRTFRNILVFFFLLFKAKQSSTHALCLSFFLLSLKGEKKKVLRISFFLFTAVLAKVKPSFTLTSRSLLRLGFHFSIAAISQGMYKRLQGSELGLQRGEHFAP